jgi:hypothetical protein
LSPGPAGPPGCGARVVAGEPTAVGRAAVADRGALELEPAANPGPLPALGRPAEPAGAALGHLPLGLGVALGPPASQLPVEQVQLGVRVELGGRGRGVLPGHGRPARVRCGQRAGSLCMRRSAVAL